VEVKRYRFGKKPKIDMTYEEKLLDLKRAIEREARLHRRRKREKNGNA